jgi:beta-aspartyl-peptidase (threonine type)
VIVPGKRITEWSRRADGWAVVVHSGAGLASPERGPAHVAACEAAVVAAEAVLADGGGAVDAAVAAVRVLENDVNTNAGTGAALTADGTLELDASVMCGALLRAGAVGALPPFKNPILVARAMLEEGERVLMCGEGAAAWAEARGFVREDAARMITGAARDRLAAQLAARVGAEPWSGGTVGCVARDRSGRLASATSTGGLVGKPRGRVGDSAIIGAGTYADDAAGAVSNTGDGEAFMRAVAAKTAVETMRAGASLSEALSLVLDHVDVRLGGLGGSIGIDALGFVGWSRTTAAMGWAATAEGWGAVEGGF